MSSFSRRQQKYVKKSYRVRNWAEYEAGLRNRGSSTVWIDVDGVGGTVPGWDAPKPIKKKPGRQQKYTDHAIETSVTLGLTFHLPSRQTEGFLKSLFSLPDREAPGRGASSV